MTAKLMIERGLKSGAVAREGVGTAEVSLAGGVVRLLHHLADTRLDPADLPRRAVPATAAGVLGDTAWVFAQRRWRRGVITRKGPVMTTVAYVTERDMDASMRSGDRAYPFTVRVIEKADHHGAVYVEPSKPLLAEQDRRQLVSYQKVSDALNAQGVPVGTPEGGEGGSVDLAVRADRIQEGDVVRIHNRDALYRVTKVFLDEEEAWLEPLSPPAKGATRAEGIDLLRRVPPMAWHIHTKWVSESERLAGEPVAVTGAGWLAEWGQVRQVGVTVGAKGEKHVGLLPWPGYVAGRGGPAPVAEVRVGDALVVDGQCYEVTWRGGPEPVMVPAPWRAR